MKPFPHNPDEAALTARLAAGKRQFEALAGDAPGKPVAYYTDASRLAFGLTCLSYAFDAPAAEVKSYAVGATRYASRAVACEDLMDPATYQRYLSLAIWTNDTNFRGRLTGFDRSQFTHPDIACDDVVYRLAEATSALARKRQEMAVECAETGLKRITRGLVSTAIVNAVAPLLQIAHAMGKGDLYTLRGAVGERNTYYLRSVSNEAARTNPEVPIDLVGLALVRLAAADYGLAVDPKSLFVPWGLF